MNNPFPLLVGLLVLALGSSAIGETYSEKLKELAATASPEIVGRFIEISRAGNTTNPEYFVASANYWWNLAQQPYLSTGQPTGRDLAVADPASGKVVGRFSTVGQADPTIPGRAIAFLTEAVGKFPERADIAIGLAFTLRAQNRPDDCLRVLLALISRAAAEPGAMRWRAGEPFPEPIDRFLSQALQSYTASFYQTETPEGLKRCRELSEAIIRTWPDNPLAYNVLAAVSSVEGNEGECARLLKTAAEKAPGDALIQLNLADSLRRLGDRDGAVAAYRKTLSISPPDDIRQQAQSALATLEK